MLVGFILGILFIAVINIVAICLLASDKFTIREVKEDDEQDISNY